MKKVTREQKKEHNRNLVFMTILNKETISRADIANITHLTRTTVSGIVAELIEEGLVQEVGIGSSTGGKSPILLSVVEDARTIIGLDLGQNQFSGAIVNLNGQLKSVTSVKVEEWDGEQELHLVYKILDQLVEIAGKPLVGIGVAAPGLVNTKEGIVINAVNLGWHDFPLANILHKRYQLPVCVINDSQANAMGHYIYGRRHGKRVGSMVTTQSENANLIYHDIFNKIDGSGNLIVINAGYGIGAGIVIGGQIFQGNGWAGEIGHISVVSENGLPCRCGNYGCLESIASEQAIVNRMRQIASQPKNNQTITLDTIVEAFNNGDPKANQVVMEAATYLGQAISSLACILNIPDVLLTGRLTRFGDPWLEVVRKAMRKTSLYGIAADTRIEIGKLDCNGFILGATTLFSMNYSLIINPEMIRGKV